MSSVPAGWHTFSRKMSEPSHWQLGYFSLCCSRKEEFITVYPADVVLFEGILMFYSQEIRELFQMKLFVDTDPDTRLSRRGVYWECGNCRAGHLQTFVLITNIL